MEARRAPDQNDAPAAFREKARSIIALEGGINPASLIKIRVLAEKLGLSDEQREAALVELRKPPRRAAEPPRPDRPPGQEAFRRAVGVRLKAEGVLTPALVRRLVEAGRREFALDEPAARAAVAEVAAEAGASVISEEQALAHITEQLVALLEAGQPLTPTRARALRDSAAQLGLTSEQVDGALWQAELDHRRRRHHSRRLDRIIIGVASAATATAVTIVALLFHGTFARPPAPPPSPRSDPDPVASVDAPDATDAPEPPAAESPRPDRDAAIAALRRALPEAAAPFQQLDAADEDDRLAALRSLLLRLKSWLDDAAARTALADLLAESLAADPSDALARSIRLELMGLLPTGDGALAARPEGYAHAFWALEVALKALARPEIDPGRADALARDLETVLATDLDRSAPPDARARDAGNALARRFLMALVEAAPALSTHALALHDALDPFARKYLSDAEREAADADFLLAALPTAGTHAADYEALIARVVNARDVAQAEKLVDLYATTSNPVLQDVLERPLLARTHVPAAAMDRSATARALRQALPGSLALPTDGDRAGTLRTLAAAALARQAATADDPDGLLQDALGLAHAATLACALAEGGSDGLARFDELARQPPRLDDPDARAVTAAANPPGAPPAGRRGFGPGLMSPGGFPRFGMRSPGDPDTAARLLVQSSQPTDRLDALGRLAAAPGELAPPYAEAVARYVLSPAKGRAEFDRMIAEFGPLARMRSVQLALADGIATSPCPRPVAERVAAAILGHDVSFERDPDWKETFRTSLLRHVLDPSNRADAAATALVELYKEQGKQLGMTSPDFLLMARPSQVLEALIAHLARRIRSQGEPAPELRDALARAPHAVTVAAHLGRDDIGRTVLLQRAWLDLLSAWIAATTPPSADRAEAIRQDLLARDRKATHVLQQLRDGEAALLRTWFLRLDPVGTSGGGAAEEDRSMAGGK